MSNLVFHKRELLIDVISSGYSMLQDVIAQNINDPLYQVISAH